MGNASNQREWRLSRRCDVQHRVDQLHVLEQPGKHCRLCIRPRTRHWRHHIRYRHARAPDDHKLHPLGPNCRPEVFDYGGTITTDLPHSAPCVVPSTTGRSLVPCTRTRRVAARDTIHTRGQQEFQKRSVLLRPRPSESCGVDPRRVNATVYGPTKLNDDVLIAVEVTPAS